MVSRQLLPPLPAQACPQQKLTLAPKEVTLQLGDFSRGGVSINPFGVSTAYERSQVSSCRQSGVGLRPLSLTACGQ